ncbi:MAG: hypothetical protein HY986_06820 [Candidatus Melainabacteria bacterium]|nr:hypothetical protein [Candidatus Melainabacteria bacterium]
MDGKHNQVIEPHREMNDKPGEQNKLSHESVGTLTSEGQRQVLADMRGNMTKAQEHLPSFTIFDDEKPVQPARPLSELHFGKAALSIFDKLDTDKNGALKNDEIIAAVQDPSYKGLEAQVVAGLYRGSRSDDTLQNYHKDATLLETENGHGISKKDLEAYETSIVYPAESHKAWGLSDKLLGKYSGGDDSLSKEDLSIALKSGTLPQREREALTFLESNYEKIDRDKGGITKEDIVKNREQATIDQSQSSATSAVESALDKAFTELTDKSGDKLYAHPENALEDIRNPESIRQAGDNCFFVATTLAVAQQNPEIIKDMIRDNQDGTYTVTFPGDRDNPITIKAPTDTEKALFHESSSAGGWGAVLEKAYGAWSLESPERRQVRDWFVSRDLPSEGAYGGESLVGGALKFLTGKDIDRDYLALSSEVEVREKLNSALNGEKHEPVLFTRIKPAHVLAVSSFDPAGAEGGTISYIDPLGGQLESMSVKDLLGTNKAEREYNWIVYGKASD